jgi:2-amino-4-hydroxy-6-hydroxymethyldihydropteridine diphosphokinase
MPAARLSILAAWMAMPRVLIALGANLGDAERHVRAGWRAAVGLLALRNPLLSQMFHSAPAEGVGGGRFVNAVGVGETSLSPHAVLCLLLAIERSLGRDRQREGPSRARALDLDLVDWHGMRLDDPQLQLPHPRLAQRDFVLRPLAEVAPDFVDVRTGQSIAQLLARLPPPATEAPV